MSQSDLENLQEISNRFDELGDALEKFLRSKNTDENSLSNPQLQTLTNIQREFAATFQEGRDAIQMAMRDADANAARRLDATINALNSRLSATQASVLIAAEKARDSLQAAEDGVLQCGTDLAKLCKDVRVISERLAVSSELKDKKINVLREEIQRVAQLQVHSKILLLLNILIILGFGGAGLLI